MAVNCQSKCSCSRNRTRGKFGASQQTPRNDGLLACAGVSLSSHTHHLPQGIDLDHNRFLILQGEVEAISLMPPKARNENETGMLEYLEDIIGTAG